MIVPDKVTYHFIIMQRMETKRPGIYVYSIPISMHYLGTREKRRDFSKDYTIYKPDRNDEDCKSLYNIKIFNCRLGIEGVIQADRIGAFQDYPLIIDYTQSMGG